jgi:hypothetical protein
MIMDFHPFSHPLSVTKAEISAAADRLGAQLATLRGFQGEVLNFAAGCTVLAQDGSSMKLPIMNAGRSLWAPWFFANMRVPIPIGRILDVYHACTLVSGRCAEGTWNSFNGWMTAVVLYSPGEFVCRCPSVLL